MLTPGVAMPGPLAAYPADREESLAMGANRQHVDRVYNRWENGDVIPHFDTIVRIAELLDISPDELAGRKETGDEPRIRNHELRRLYQKVDQLSDEDQKALVIVLDSLVKRSRVSQVMAEL